MHDLKKSTCFSKELDGLDFRPDCIEEVMRNHSMKYYNGTFLKIYSDTRLKTLFFLEIGGIFSSAKYSPIPNKRVVLIKSVGWIMIRKRINVYT